MIGSALCATCLVGTEPYATAMGTAVAIWVPALLEELQLPNLSRALAAALPQEVNKLCCNGGQPPRSHNPAPPIAAGQGGPGTREKAELSTVSTARPATAGPAMLAVALLLPLLFGTTVWCGKDLWKLPIAAALGWVQTPGPAACKLVSCCCWFSGHNPSCPCGDCMLPRSGDKGSRVGHAGATGPNGACKAPGSIIPHVGLRLHLPRVARLLLPWNFSWSPCTVLASSSQEKSSGPSCRTGKRVKAVGSRRYMHETVALVSVCNRNLLAVFAWPVRYSHTHLYVAKVSILCLRLRAVRGCEPYSALWMRICYTAQSEFANLPFLASAEVPERLDVRHSHIIQRLYVLQPLGKPQIHLAVEHQVTGSTPGVKEKMGIAFALRPLFWAYHILPEDISPVLCRMQRRLWQS